jgi:hypothetical protein
MHLNILTRTSNCPNYFLKIRRELKSCLTFFETHYKEEFEKVTISHIISAHNEFTQKYVNTEIKKNLFVNSHCVRVQKRNAPKHYNVYITELVYHCRLNLPAANIIEPVYYIVLDDDATLFHDFLSVVLTTLLKNKNLDILIWRCKYDRKEKVIPNLNKCSIISSDNPSVFTKLYGDIDSLNYCVKDSAFCTWTSTPAMDYKSLVSALRATPPERRLFIPNVIAHINKDGPRNGNQKDT